MFLHEALEGLNWWNSNDFPVYLKNLHINPWELLNTIEKRLNDIPIIIDLKCYQLNRNNNYSEDILDLFLAQFEKKDQIFMKVFDPLNDVQKIRKVISLCTKHNIKIIGGIFLRPDLENFPDCHIELIKLYKEHNISYISLIEPLGLLKEGQITKIKNLIDNFIQNYKVNLSIKLLKFQQPLLINEAIQSGIKEIDCSILSKFFGFPSYEAIVNSLIFLKADTSALSLPLKLLNKIKTSPIEEIISKVLKTEKILNYAPNTYIPLELINSVENLRYFTNVPFKLDNILEKMEKIKNELGNPPYLEPFSTIIVSQAIFMLQNGKKGIKTLDTLKYLSEYWGKQNGKIDGEFRRLLPVAKKLKQKNHIFQAINTSDLNLTDLPSRVNSKIKNDKEKLLFIISPTDSIHYFTEYLPNPTTIDFSKKENIARLVKSILESQKQERKELLIPTNNPSNINLESDFRWRYLSRLFQIGKF